MYVDIQLMSKTTVSYCDTNMQQWAMNAEWAKGLRLAFKLPRFTMIERFVIAEDSGKAGPDSAVSCRLLVRDIRQTA